MILSNSYLLEGDAQGAEECLRNIYIAEHEARPRFNPFRKYLEHQSQWLEIMNVIDTHRDKFSEHLKKIND